MLIANFPSLYRFYQKSIIVQLLTITFFVVVTVHFGHAQTDNFLKRLKTKNGLVVPLPLITYSPETRWGFGFSGQYLFRVKGDSLNNISTVGASALYTLEKQFIFNPNWDFFIQQNSYRLHGAFVYQKFPEYFYGVGNQTSKDEREKFTAKYVMLRNRFTRQITTSGFHLGLQYRLEYAFDFQTDTTGNLNSGLIKGSEGYLASGAGLSALYDTRDNNMFPFKGYYLIFSNHFYTRWLGSDSEFAQFKVDARGYFNPFTSNVIAVQALTSFHAGEPPFKMLSLLGGPETMRGYYAGRYRDRHLMAGQVEWRFPIWWRFIGTGFYGTGFVTNDYKDLKWNRLQHSFGGGLRFTVDAAQRINLRFDAAFGTDGSRGFYFMIGEAF